MQIEINDVNIYYEIYGDGIPILAIHGFTPDHRLMKGCMEPIFTTRTGYQRIYFDLPGMGKTPSSSTIENSDDILLLVLGFIDSIIGKKPFLIISESYGCYIARGIIFQREMDVYGAAFICPLIQPKLSKRVLPKRIHLYKEPDFLKTLSSKDRKEFVSMTIIQNRRIWQRFKEDILTGLETADNDFLNEIFFKGYPFSFDVDEAIDFFDKPSLFLLGRQDISVGYHDAWEILEKYPRASFAILDLAGHSLQIEQETLFNALISEWLDRVQFHLKHSSKHAKWRD
jgi:pimeloyl-ACP methyl ester carboxylesterase